MAVFSSNKVRQEYRSKGIFHTNKELAKYLMELMYKYGKPTEIVDLCVGSGGLIEQFPDDIAKYGCDTEQEFIDYCKANIKGEFKCASIFDKPFGNKKFDFIIGNYPFSLKGVGKDYNKLFPFYSYELSNTLDNAFILANIEAMSDKGVCILIVANGVMFRNKKEANFRKWLLEQNLIEHIENIEANKHFDDTKIPTTLLVLKKGRDTDNFTMRDITLDKEISLDRNEILSQDDDWNLSVNRYMIELEIPTISEEEAKQEIDRVSKEQVNSTIKGIKLQLEIQRNMIKFDREREKEYRQLVTEGLNIFKEALENIDKDIEKIHDLRIS